MSTNPSSPAIDNSSTTTSTEQKQGTVNLKKLQEDVRIYEYSSAANPDILPIPVLALPAQVHQSGESRVIPFDLSTQMGLSYPATSPNLLASFIRILANESLDTEANATSQAFYIINGSGQTTSSSSVVIPWAKGDLFVLPATTQPVIHSATTDAAIYWITDQPLLSYLGVKPSIPKFQPTLFKQERMLREVEEISHAPGAEHLNRMGILLGNKITENTTKTLTHVMWSLVNVLPPGNNQRPHRHNSVALDLCISSAPIEGKGVYTNMGPELDEEGWVKDPIRCDWKTGAVFVTPPGWWHSHHNETDTPAWVLPIQDAGLHTYMRTLDITFSVGPGETRH